MSNRFSDLTPAQLVLALFFMILILFGFISLKAWLLGIVLGWFGVTLGFWKNFLIIFLIDLLIGSTQSSSK